MRISDWSSDVCSSDLVSGAGSSLSATQSFVDASGRGGGNAGFFQSQNGGDGTGGTAEILIDADAASTISLGSAGVFAIGEGGNADASENTTGGDALGGSRSEEHTSELQSLMRHSYAVFCL